MAVAVEEVVLCEVRPPRTRESVFSALLRRVFAFTSGPHTEKDGKPSRLKTSNNKRQTQQHSHSFTHTLTHQSKNPLPLTEKKRHSLQNAASRQRFQQHQRKASCQNHQTQNRRQKTQQILRQKGRRGQREAKPEKTASRQGRRFNPLHPQTALPPLSLCLCLFLSPPNHLASGERREELRCLSALRGSAEEKHGQGSPGSPAPSDSSSSGSRSLQTPELKGSGFAKAVLQTQSPRQVSQRQGRVGRETQKGRHLRGAPGLSLNLSCAGLHRSDVCRQLRAQNCERDRKQTPLQPSQTFIRFNTAA